MRGVAVVYSSAAISNRSCPPHRGHVYEVYCGYLFDLQRLARGCNRDVEIVELAGGDIVDPSGLEHDARDIVSLRAQTGISHLPLRVSLDSGLLYSPMQPDLLAHLARDKCALSRRPIPLDHLARF